MFRCVWSKDDDDDSDDDDDDDEDDDGYDESRRPTALPCL